MGKWIRPDLTVGQQKKKKKGLCITNRCISKAGKRVLTCDKHSARERKERNPIGYLYNIKKQRAKERGIDWNWPLNEFRKFIEDTGYLNKTGRYAASMTIDRKNHLIGYQTGNVQILGHSENSAKGYQEGKSNVPF